MVEYKRDTIVLFVDYVFFFLSWFHKAANLSSGALLCRVLFRLLATFAGYGGLKTLRYDSFDMFLRYTLRGTSFSLASRAHASNRICVNASAFKCICAQVRLCASCICAQVHLRQGASAPKCICARRNREHALKRQRIPAHARVQTERLAP